MRKIMGIDEMFESLPFVVRIIILLLLFVSSLTRAYLIQCYLPSSTRDLSLFDVTCAQVREIGVKSCILTYIYTLWNFMNKIRQTLCTTLAFLIHTLAHMIRLLRQNAICFHFSLFFPFLLNSYALQLSQPSNRTKPCVPECFCGIK